MNIFDYYYFNINGVNRCLFLVIGVFGGLYVCIVFYSAFKWMFVLKSFGVFFKNVFF